MAKYNIYKIDKSKEDGLKTKLESVYLTPTKSKTIGDFTLTFYLPQNAEHTTVEIWWTELYTEYLNPEDIPQNRAYYAVMLISSSTLCYTVGLGKSHFYLKEFCDPDFGINLAQRIADPKDFRIKHSKLFGGKKNKAIYTYTSNSELEYDSGESIQYIKAKTTDDKWGETASFGHSVQLQNELTPDSLPNIITDIEAELAKPPNFSLPRSEMITDIVKIAELDTLLCDNLLNGSETITTDDASLSGVEFIFQDTCEYTLKLGYIEKDCHHGLTIEALRQFISEKQIDLLSEIERLKIKVKKEGGGGYTKPLKYFLNFIHPTQRYFLLDGKWYSFNQDYLDYLKQQIDEKIDFEQGEAFSKLEYQNVTSKEDFFNAKQQQFDYLNFHLQMTQLHQYKFEQMDLFKAETAFFVKIGNPQNFAYVIDQSMSTLKLVKNHLSEFIHKNQTLQVKRMCLWLIPTRSTPITKISDFNSIILLIKLAEWQRACVNSSFTPIVRVSYITD